MDTDKAWEIVREFYRIEEFSEDETILYEEALNYILTEALELSEADDFYMWKTDVEAGAFNLAAYYEKIGKYELAMKYYTISEEYGCDFANERIERLRELI